MACGRRHEAAHLYYEKQAGNVYDRAEVIDDSLFTEDQLVSLSQQTIARERQHHRLIRLTVSYKERWLQSALPAFDYHFLGLGDDYRKELFASEIAQMVYLDGSATLTIKSGAQTTTRRILGSGEPFQVTVNGTRVPLDTFALSTVSESTFFYVRADPLPSLEQSKTVLSALWNVAGTRASGLVVRPDTLFGSSGGWICDVFRLPYPNISKDKYRHTEYVYCYVPTSDTTEGRSAAPCSYQEPSKAPDIPFG